jgi:hypothetical protein
MAAVETQQRTHCSVCGKKVVRQDMPYCIYCGNHFEMMEGGAGKKRKETRNMARLAKMPEHEDYAAALERDLGEGPEFDRWRRGARAGQRTLMLGVILIALGVVLGWGVPAIAAGIVILVLGAAWLVRMKTFQSRRLAMPMMKRAAVVTDRRSETQLRFNTGITTYFFTLEFADGNEAEFRYPGRGAHTEPLSKGVTGIAHTRGDELIEFEQIRV